MSKIIYQMVVVGKVYRTGAIHGMVRLALVGVCFGVGYYFTSDISESDFSCCGFTSSSGMYSFCLTNN